MKGWALFWTAAILAGGTSFAVATVIVSIKGARDLVEMIRRLNERG